jgi:formylglycine-generating enzyme required for sulfatase activity
MDQPAPHRLKGYGVTESAVRIEDQEGHIQGSGVAVSPRHVATCAHVVLDALGLERNAAPPEGATLTAAVWRAHQPQVLMLRVAAWRPVSEGDLAVLESPPQAPDLLPACSQVLRDDQWQGQSLEAFGFPEGFDRGQAATLSSQTAIADGRIQCAPTREGISPGYSGGPVFHNGDLVGLAQARRRFTDPQRRYDYIIPLARLRSLMPRLAGPLRQPYYALAEALAAGTVPPVDQVRRTSPHTHAEYCLWRQARDWDTQDIRLDFTPLLMLMEERRRDADYGEGPQPEPLDNLGEALKRAHRAYLLKGAPGSGKTTLLRRLAFDLASEAGAAGPLPVLIELASHRDTLSPRQWLDQFWRDNLRDMPGLEELATPILWLLDGLNELPDELRAPRSDKIAAWRDWLDTQVDRHRAIVSCRSADYLQELDEVRARPVPHLELQPLDLPKIAEFLRNRTALNPAQAEAAIGHIAEKGLEHLYDTPLMLTLLEVVLSPEGDFPDGRADLFSTYLCRLVLREHTKHRALIADLFRDSERQALADAARPSDARHDRAAARRRLVMRSNAFLDALSGQAYQRQRVEYRGDRQEVSFDRLELEDDLRASYPEQGERILNAALALNLLIQGEEAASLRFRHQQFQEFFAARSLAREHKVDLARAPHRPEGFQQALEAVRSEMRPWQELPGVDRSGWEETVLMAAGLAEDRDAFIADLAQVNLPLAGQCAAREAVAVNTRVPLAERLLVRMRDPDTDLRARIAAGRALGELQALEVLGYEAVHREGRRLAWLPPLATVPAGDYTFGSENDPEAYEDEHRFTEYLPAFRLGRYPVTNAEWRCFIRAGGYQEPRWWAGKAAQAFFQGRGTNEGQAQAWLWWRSQNAQGRLAESLDGAGLDPEAQEWVRETTALDEQGWVDFLEQVRGRSERVSEPAWWRAGRYDNPLQPVVGISLFEALAYCGWLSELAGEAYGLPHELQWEAAARGSGRHPRRYAFGEAWIPDLCNVREPGSVVGAPTPVGLYEAGRTPDTGLYDITGNVWEWTTSAWAEVPPYDTGPLERLNDASQPRVVRGGAWNPIRRLARAAYRNLSRPDFRDSLLGCRVCAASPPDP